MALAKLKLQRVRKYYWAHNLSTTRTQLTSILGYLNDLWTYKVKNPGWVYMAGSKEANQQSVYGEMGTPAEENVPAARSGAVGWYDATSQGLWLFGGVSHYGTYLWVNGKILRLII